MKQEDLIKKLESLETPEIELSGHRQALRMALLNSGRFRQRNVMDWARILAPISAAVVLLVVVGFFHLIQPQLQIAQAKEIAGNDPHVQALLEERGLEISEVKVQDGEAFVLLAPQSSSTVLYSSTREGSRFFRWSLPFLPESSVPTPGEVSPTPPGELLPGYVLRIDLLEKKVSELGEIDEVKALGDINLDEMDFARLEPAEVTAPEEDDVD
ncbi:MAG: hypothetical protein R6V59_08065 [Dehalococcoidia bacterium]